MAASSDIIATSTSIAHLDAMAATQICRNSEVLVLRLQQQILSIQEDFKLEVQRSLQHHIPVFRRDLDVELQKQVGQIRRDLEQHVQDLYKREREQPVELHKHQILNIQEDLKLEVQRSLQHHLPVFRRDLDVELQKQVCEIRGDLEQHVQDLYKESTKIRELFSEQRLELQKQVVEFRRDIIQTDAKMETEIRSKIVSIGNDLAALTKAHGVALSDTLAKANQEVQLKQQATDSAVKLLQDELESTKATVQILQAFRVDHRKLEEESLELKSWVVATKNPSTDKTKHVDNRKLEEESLELKSWVAATMNPSKDRTKHAPLLDKDAIQIQNMMNARQKQANKPLSEEEATGIGARYVEKWRIVTHGEVSVGLPFNAKDASIAKDVLITSSDLSSTYSKSSGAWAHPTETQQTQMVPLTPPPPEFLHSEDKEFWSTVLET